MNFDVQGGPSQYDYIDPKGYDINGNGYVSVKESYDTMMNSMHRYLSAMNATTYSQEIIKYGISDLSNISENTYLGDFNVNDQQ